MEETRKWINTPTSNVLKVRLPVNACLLCSGMNIYAIRRNRQEAPYARLNRGMLPCQELDPPASERWRRSCRRTGLSYSKPIGSVLVRSTKVTRELGIMKRSPVT